MSTSSGRYQVGATGRWSGTLEREDGARVGTANITGGTITLRDAISGAYIRGTSGGGQSIWNAGVGTNDFTFADATDTEGKLVTNVGWNVLTTDVALQSAILAREEHVAEIVINYSQDGVAKTIRHTHRLRCVDAPALCTYDDVLAAVPDLDETKARIQIEDAIEAFTAMVERRTLRKLRKSTVAAPTTETFTMQGYERTVQLARYPVDSVVSVTQDYSGVFTGVDPEAADSYVVDAERGWVTRREVNWLKGEQSLRVVYAGGLFRDTGAVDADLRWAAVQQVVHWWKFRDKLGVVSISVPGSSVTQYSQKPLLPAVESVVNDFRRPRRW